MMIDAESLLCWHFYLTMKTISAHATIVTWTGWSSKHKLPLKSFKTKWKDNWKVNFFFYYYKSSKIQIWNNKMEDKKKTNRRWRGAQIIKEWICLYDNECVLYKQNRKLCVCVCVCLSCLSSSAIPSAPVLRLCLRPCYTGSYRRRWWGLWLGYEVAV